MGATPKLSRSSKRQLLLREAGHGPVIGLEAEFSLYVNEQRRKPEEVFRRPARLVRAQTIPRKGRSIHLPSGGALYFDTGVIEVATPIIELEPGCAERASRSLWEQIAYVRTELDAWQVAHQEPVRIEGFSAHYNLSIVPERQLSRAGMHRLALLLTYLLPAPMMLLAANRMSTGVGVRPRDGRIEVTVDFTPDEDLMTSTAAFLAAVIPAVANWPEHGLEVLAARKLPVIAGFKPCAHTSRKGFLARFDCFPQNPFVTDPNAPVWHLEDGSVASLRRIAANVLRPFRSPLRAIASAETVHHVRAVIAGRARSLLDFAEQPREYRDVCRRVHRRVRGRGAERSRYERVIHRVITRQPIRIGPFSYRAERMVGWYQVAMRNLTTGHRRTFTLDELALHAGI